MMSLRKNRVNLYRRTPHARGLATTYIMHTYIVLIVYDAFGGDTGTNLEEWHVLFLLGKVKGGGGEGREDTHYHVSYMGVVVCLTASHFCIAGTGHVGFSRPDRHR